uniref:(northern house mosquito) hypothetical protein n=1 Tax=Culex pipiens TaxID=7175 RepID=A0A8D8L7H7_CULPI
MSNRPMHFAIKPRNVNKVQRGKKKWFAKFHSLRQQIIGFAFTSNFSFETSVSRYRIYHALICLLPESNNFSCDKSVQSADNGSAVFYVVRTGFRSEKGQPF